MDDIKNRKDRGEDLVSVSGWSHLIGYDFHLKKMASLYSAGLLPTVLLIEGREGIGKRTFADAVGALFFCQYGTACGKCEGCRSVMNGTELDLLRIEPEANSIKIEEIKKFQEHLSLHASEISGSFRGERSLLQRPSRVVVMCDIDRMTTQAANRLLKTLEEPSEDARIILTTSRIGNLLATIRGRTVLWHIAPPDEGRSRRWLQSRLLELGRADVNEQTIINTLRLVGLAPGRALRLLLDDCDYEHIERSIEKILTTSTIEEGLEIAEDISRQKKLSAFELTERVEVVLNRLYKQAFHIEDKTYKKCSDNHIILPPVGVLNEWRKTIRKVKKAAGQGKIALNCQLTIEALLASRF